VFGPRTCPSSREEKNTVSSHNQKGKRKKGRLLFYIPRGGERGEGKRITHLLTWGGKVGRKAGTPFNFLTEEEKKVYLHREGGTKEKKMAQRGKENYSLARRK